jgi:lysophospholipase L1-like esterase
MKSSFLILIILLASLFMITSCSLEEPKEKMTTPPALSTGTANFTQYVSLGNSLTAGYQSAALTAEDQGKSYPKLIATQVGKGASFIQPLIAYPGLGSYTAKGAGILKLTGFDSTSNPVISPVPYASVPAFNPANPYYSDAIRNHAAPYNNLGIPGIVLADMDSAVTTANSYSHSGLIDPILRNPNFGNTNPIKQAMLLSPTFITCWIGNNDVLGYATSGGVSPAAPTAAATFQYLYNNLLTKITAGGAKVVVANIPDVTSIPFFTTVPYQVEVQGNVIALVIKTAAGDVRQATADDLILLTAKSIIGDVSGTYGPAGVPVGLNVNAPLASQYVLDESEVEIAKQAVADFNTAIAAVAASKSIPVVDMNGLMADASDADGLPYAGFVLSSDFITGQLFSLDGVHPSTIGNAVVANAWISKINSTFNATIPLIDIMQFKEDEQPFKLASSSVKFDPEVFKDVITIFGGSIE